MTTQVPTKMELIAKIKDSAGRGIAIASGNTTHYSFDKCLYRFQHILITASLLENLEYKDSD